MSRSSRNSTRNPLNEPASPSKTQSRAPVGRPVTDDAIDKFESFALDDLADRLGFFGVVVFRELDVPSDWSAQCVRTKRQQSCTQPGDPLYANIHDGSFLVHSSL